MHNILGVKIVFNLKIIQTFKNGQKDKKQDNLLGLLNVT